MYILHPLYGNIKNHLKNERHSSTKLKTKVCGSNPTKECIYNSGCFPEKRQLIQDGKGQTDANNKPCVYCKGEQHSLTVCKKLVRQPHKDFLKSKGLCFGCLKHGNDCKEKVKCEECSWLHPTLLLHMKTKYSHREMVKESSEQQSISSALVQMMEPLGVTGAGAPVCSFECVLRHKREPRQWKHMPFWIQVAQVLLLQIHW